MNTKIHYLRQLEDDLAAASRREGDPSRASGGSGDGPRRLPRRGRRSYRWSGLVAAMLAVLVVAASIGFLVQRGGSSDEPASGGEAASVDDGLRTAPPGAFPGFETSDAVEQAPGQPQDLSKIVRDGRIEVEVANGRFDQNVAAVSRIASNNGGFVLTSATRNGQTGTFTMRIPAKRFDAVMDQLRALGTVKTDRITGQDVTAEFIDLKARLKILTDRRELLRELQADATSSGEILRFATLIDDVQLEIEKIQGNLNFLKDQVAEATIEVGLREHDAPDERPPADVDRPSLSAAFDHATQGFLRVVGAVVVGLGYLIPLAVLGALVWLAFSLLRRRTRRA